MKPAVALAMLEREGRWLLQLRDDIDSIIYPGHWGLFGGHLDPGAEMFVSQLTAWLTVGSVVGGEHSGGF